MKFSWVKGLGLGSALPDWLRFVIEQGEVLGWRGYGVWGEGGLIARRD
jgi:hypothetical protein